MKKNETRMSMNKFLKGIIISVWGLMILGTILSVLGGMNPFIKHGNDYFAMIVMTIILYSLVEEKKDPILNRFFNIFKR